jgi:hypothetical protein
MTTATPAYETLSATWKRMHNLSHLQSIAGWDQAANMPPKGNEARAAALTEMAALLHRMRTDPQLPDQLARAEQEPLTDMQRANLREMKRQWHASNALPEVAGAAPADGQFALRTRLAHAAAGQRLAGLSGQLPRGAGHRARRSRAAVGPDRPAQIRRADGPLRAGHDLCAGRPHLSAMCGNGCPA